MLSNLYATLDEVMLGNAHGTLMESQLAYSGDSLVDL